MSSASSFNTIRRHSSNAADIRLKELTQELARTRSEIAGSQLETDDVRSQGRMDHSTIKVNDDRLKFVTTLQSSNTDFFYEFPTEPDLNNLKVWFMLDHLGARMRDMSGFGNHAFISGHPTLRRVGLNLGFQQTSDAGGTSATPTMLFNSGTDVVSQKNGEYIWIQDNPSIQFTQFSVGFSITFRFNCLDFNNHESVEFGSFLRRFASKTDNATNGWNLVVYQLDQTGTNGVLEMYVVHDGVTYKRRRTGFNVNAWYQVVVTYNPNVTADQRIKIYVAGTEGTTAGTASLILSPHTNLRIGARDSETGFFYGYLHDFRLYMDKVLTQTEVTNINTNEMTIDSITRGHVFVIQYAMVSQAMRSKTHRYNVGGYIIRERHHKFNIIKKLTVTRTHKFNMVKGVSRTRTHRFTMVGLVLRLRTHRYGVGGTIRVNKTHKYNLLQDQILTQVLRFQKNASNIDGATQAITFNFTPKAIQVISVSTTTDNTVGANYQYSHGFSDGTNHACVVASSRDGTTSSDTARSHRTDCVYARVDELFGNTTIECRASVAFSTNTVTFTWDVNDSTAAYITVLAVGGGGITNAKVSTVAVARTTTGVQNFTGLGFNPIADQSVLFTLASETAASANLNTLVDNANHQFGCAVSTSKRWSMSNISMNGQTESITYRKQYNNLVIGTMNSLTGNTYYNADFDSWITDGFALNFTTAPAASTIQFSYLVIKGGRWDAGNLTTPTAVTNDVDYAVSVNSKTPKALLTSTTSHITTTINTRTSTAIICTGVTDGTTQIINSALEEDFAATMDNYRVQNTGNIIKQMTNNGVVTDIAIFDSFSANNFRLDWTTKTINAQIIGWVVVSDT